MNTVQRQRLLWRTAFFALFVLAPVLDLFRLDLIQGHFILFGMPWTLGVRDVGGLEASLNLVLRAFLPIALVIGAGVWVSWRYGRLYCGWLCPHFSVVEVINSLMRRASGKPTLWQRDCLPEVQSDGVRIRPQHGMWLLVALAVLLFSLLWAWGNLFTASLTRNQFIFISVATALFIIEFTFARHLFCRYGCAIGLFQSLVWMANRKALVVGFDRERAAECANCDSSCEHRRVNRACYRWWKSSVRWMSPTGTSDAGQSCLAVVFTAVHNRRQAANGRMGRSFVAQGHHPCGPARVSGGGSQAR
jgi:polyferredoxin